MTDRIAEHLRLLVNDEERDLETIRDEAAKCIEKSQHANKIAFNSSHKKPLQYKLDDLVMVANYDTTPGVNKKLLPKYRGPYKISTILPNDRYIVKDVENWQVTQKPYEGTHGPAQMRPWIGNVRHGIV